MTDFLITLILSTISVGLLFGLIFTVDLKGIKRIIIASSIAIVIGTILSVIFTHEAKNKQTDWNNGICPTCGVEWEFKNGENPYLHSETLYYVCPKCQTVIKQ